MRFGKLASTVLFYILIFAIFVSFTYLCSETTAVIAQQIPMERDATIVIDAGHGGEDGGATSCTGIPESAFNLDIALRLNDLMHLLGYDTAMIRTTDISVYTEGNSIAQKKVSDLKQRVKLINETENALLVSIHQNAFPESKYSGAQVFYSPEGKSRELANALQQSFSQTINPGSKRQSKAADGIYLMERINCTGVLVECGFLSNPTEEAALRDADYQKKLCCVIASTVGNFLDH